MNANDWLTTELQKVDHQKWGAGNLPHGTLFMPKEKLEADKTLEIPFRHCMQGPDIHTLKLHGIEATEGFPSGEPLLRSGMDWSAQRDAAAGRRVDYNGNFSTHYRDFYLDCKNVATGIEFGGAQCSSLSNITIRHSNGPAVGVLRGSTRVAIRDLDIENGEPNANTRLGTGVMLIENRGVHMQNINLHCVDVGLSVINSSSVTVQGATLEKVNRLAISGLGHELYGLNWQWPSDLPLNLTKNAGGTSINVCFSKAPQTLYYMDNTGRKKHLVTFHSAISGSRQVYMEIKTSWQKWLKRLDLKVDVKTWNG